MMFHVGNALVDMLDGDRVCASVASGKPFEPESLALWGQLCERGGTVIDVGAYTGLFSIAAVLLGCRAVAFEPLPNNAARLIENAMRNNARARIRLVEAAASDKCGETTITYNPKVPFTSGASLIRLKGVKLPISTVTIDSYPYTDLRAIKIDAERAEPLVLAGAVETIRRHRPDILVEVLDDERKAGVLAALPDYRVEQELDERNWHMVPA